MTHMEPPTRLSAGASPGSAWKLESALSSTIGSDCPHALFVPLHYEPNYAYPLIVWLHGPGGHDERQLTWIMPLVSLRNYVAVAPRGFACDTASGAVHHDWPQTPDHIAEAECRVVEAIRSARRRCHVSDSRVFLAGFDTGGTMALRLAFGRPWWFAGMLSFGGAVPDGHRPLGLLTEARRLPVFLALGRDSLSYPPARACENLRLLHAAGFSVTLRQYPCGHQLAPEMLADMDRWIMEVITQPSGLPEGGGPPAATPTGRARRAARRWKRNVD